jgi:hypothetical protein
MITRRLFSLGALATPLILRHPSYGRIVPVTGWTAEECEQWLRDQCNLAIDKMLRESYDPFKITPCYRYETLPPEPGDVENRIARMRLMLG